MYLYDILYICRKNQIMNKPELRIRELCKEKGITQAQLAKKLGILPVSFSQSMSRSNFNMERLSEISEALGVEVPDLFKRKEDGINTITCPNCGKRFKMEDSHIPGHENIRGKEYYK